MTKFIGCYLLFLFIFCLEVVSDIVQADVLGEVLQPGTVLSINDSLVNQCPCTLSNTLTNLNTSMNTSTNLTFVDGASSLNCSCNSSVTPSAVPSCISSDPDCLRCTRAKIDNVQISSVGRCVLFGPTRIDPVNGPSRGGRLTTIYGEYFGSSADAKVQTCCFSCIYTRIALVQDIFFSVCCKKCSTWLT
jgi:hypothetical protein